MKLLCNTRKLIFRPRTRLHPYVADDMRQAGNASWQCQPSGHGLSNLHLYYPLILWNMWPILKWLRGGEQDLGVVEWNRGRCMRGKWGPHSARSHKGHGAIDGRDEHQAAKEHDEHVHRIRESAAHMQVSVMTSNKFLGRLSQEQVAPYLSHKRSKPHNHHNWQSMDVLTEVCTVSCLPLPALILFRVSYVFTVPVSRLPLAPARCRLRTGAAVG